jgi:hypothetical protein
MVQPCFSQKHIILQGSLVNSGFIPSCIIYAGIWKLIIISDILSNCSRCQNIHCEDEQISVQLQ